MEEEILNVEKLTKAFTDVIANNEIDFQVIKGEIHCLLGENGAGKSTLAECLYGFLKFDNGKCRFNGQDYSPKSPRDAINVGIGMVHQHFCPGKKCIRN